MLFTFHKNYDILKIPRERGFPSFRRTIRERTADHGGVNLMKISVSGKQMNVRDSLRDTIERKLHKFDRFFGDETEAQVTCKVRKGVKIVEITIRYGSVTFRSEEESDTFEAALDRSVDSLERQIRKNKTRLEKTVRRDAFHPTETAPEEEIEEDDELVVRTKTYDAKPMTIPEAILQMNLVGHTFFVFCDADSGKTEVVYKRKDGNYGVLMPE